MPGLSPAKTVLVIDDDEILCEAISEGLGGEGLRFVAAHSLKDGLGVCSRRKVDVVLLDQNLPDGDGQDILYPILKYNDRTKIILITAYPSFNNAVKAIKAGAYDYLSKPFELEELRLVIGQSLRTLDLEGLEQVHNYKDDKESEGAVLVGGGLAEVRKLIEMAASVDSTVLITGETGTGKNVSAKAIHYKSPARKGAFISINCAAIPETLIEAELFGYEKGAFTGAASARKGIFEIADGGTLLLDEIGEMPLHLQAKLLSVLEDKKIMRLGGESVRPVDVRIIATTNAELDEAVKGRAFRKDLYYRLSVVRMHMPPLRARREDIPELCGYLVNRIAGGRGLVLPGDEVERLLEYDWPGNVRELQNVLERSVMLCKGDVLRPSELLTTAVQGSVCPAAPPGSCVEEERLVTLGELEDRYIRHALERFSGNYTRTAKALGISLSTLKRRVRNGGRHPRETNQ